MTRTSISPESTTGPDLLEPSTMMMGSIVEGPSRLDSGLAPRAMAGRRTLREKFWAGLSGWKHALRGDSSFFAHGYRVVLVAMTATMLGVGTQGWLILILAACMIFIAELNHSAIDTLARAIGDPEEPRLKVAREIAAGAVLVAVVGSAIVVVVILFLRLTELLGR